MCYYIVPIIGHLKIKEITARTLGQYYTKLLKTPAVPKATDSKYKKKATTYVTPATIRKIHNVLRSAMTQAEKWELLEHNPAKLATVPKSAPNCREIWDAQTLFKAIESCQDKASLHNSATRENVPFAPSASCKNLDLPPVNHRFLQSYLTQKSLFIAPLHLCGAA